MRTQTSASALPVRRFSGLRRNQEGVRRVGEGLAADDRGVEAIPRVGAVVPHHRAPVVHRQRAGRAAAPPGVLHHVAHQLVERAGAARLGPDGGVQVGRVEQAGIAEVLAPILANLVEGRQPGAEEQRMRHVGDEAVGEAAPHRLRPLEVEARLVADPAAEQRARQAEAHGPRPAQLLAGEDAHPAGERRRLPGGAEPGHGAQQEGERGGAAVAEEGVIGRQGAREPGDRLDRIRSPGGPARRPPRARRARDPRGRADRAARP